MILSRQLEPSRTYKNRRYDLTVSGNVLFEAVLTIKQGEEHRKNYDCEKYAVQKQYSPNPAALIFLLLKDSSDEVWETIIYAPAVGEIIAPDNPPPGSCTCKAGRCRLWCKHRDALTDAALLLGWFPGRPAEPIPTPPERADHEERQFSTTEEHSSG